MEKQHLKQELKNTFTSYWQYLALRTACQLNIFDDIDNGDNTIERLVLKSKADTKALKVLIDALVDAEAIKWKNENLSLTEKGCLLTDSSPDSLKQACILWGGEHLSAWQSLAYTIKSGKSACEYLFGEQYFDCIEQDKFTNYHLAMAEYARDDYKDITRYIDFSEFNVIADVGGGTGSLIKTVALQFPNKRCILVDLPKVCNVQKINLQNLIIEEADFFKQLTFKADAIILSRVLHDWNDDKAIAILQNCCNSLNEGGKLFIIENMQNEVNANLLSLNMMLMTESFERTYSQYDKLLQNVDCEIKSTVKLNKLQTILTAQKK